MEIGIRTGQNQAMPPSRGAGRFTMENLAPRRGDRGRSVNECRP